MLSASLLKWPFGALHERPLYRYVFFSQIDSYSADHRELELEKICTEITEKVTQLEDMFLRTT